MFGAWKVFKVVPENSVTGYIMTIIPLLAFMINGVYFAIVVQIAGIWSFAGAVIFYCMAEMVPALAYWKGIGPHDSDSMWALWVESKVTIAQVLLYVLCLLCLIYTVWDYRNWPIDINIEVSVWTVLSLIFSFLLSRVVTTI